MTNSLLHCPFCKGKPYVENFYDKTLFAITCLKCKATTDWYTSYEAAAAAWNTRAEPIAMENIKAYTRLAVAEAERTCKNLEYDPPWFTCSNCGTVHTVEYFDGGYDAGNYCPNCGSKVVE